MQAATIQPIRTTEEGARPKFDVRRASRADMSMIAGFVRSTAEWYRPFLAEKDMAEHDVDAAWEEKNFQRRDFYVGRVDGVAVGTISLQFFGPYAYLGYIYLAESHVGKGYGQVLMKFAAAVARERGMRGLALIAHPKATWAKRAYLKFGFDIIAEDKSEVLNWQGGILKEYYEEGFELYLYNFAAKGEAV